MSVPAMNIPSVVLVSTTARSPGSAAACASSAPRRSYMAKVTALRRAGRFTAIRSTPAARLTTRSSSLTGDSLHLPDDPPGEQVLDLGLGQPSRPQHRHAAGASRRPGPVRQAGPARAAEAGAATPWGAVLPHTPPP